MRIYLHIAAALLALVACRPGINPGKEARAEALVAQAAAATSNQHFDQAMEKALEALALSEGNPLGQVHALSCIVGIDIMTSRDADGWEKVAEAEAIARQHGFNKELSEILISKAKLCSYAEVSPDTGRNDEGLEYAGEALAIANEADLVEQQAEAYYVLASLYINKNRWNNPIDEDIYRKAGEYLDKGQALAQTYDIPRLRRNGLLFRSRWFQQGDRNAEAIQYFTQVLQGLKDTDHLTAASLYDRLVRLYTRIGDNEKALDAHDQYVFHMGQYMSQKSDETLQEMETRYEVQGKELQLERRKYQIALLVAILLLAAIALVLIGGRLRKVRRRNTELARINDTKEEIIAFLSKDLKNPTNEYASSLEKLSAEAATMSTEQIRQKCREIARDAQSINEDVAGYVGDVLIERARKIADIGLSQREVQIIRLSAEGLKASEIAERTFLSVHTVNTHRQRIYAKMDVGNISEMLHKAQELGII